MASKKTILFFAAAALIFPLSSARAQVLISEFVSDPDSGKEWIEFRNSSSADVDLSGWYWTELAGPGTDTEHESSPKALHGGVPAGGFFVLEASSALNNTGDSIALYEGAELKDRVTFGAVKGHSKDLEAPAKGKSGALIGGSWYGDQTPTRGAANPSGASSGAEGTDGDDSAPRTSTKIVSANSPRTASSAPERIEADISVPEIGYVGIPLAFSGRTTQNGEQLYSGRYFWNFGDGDFREVKVINTDTFTHTYYHPGEYNVLFEHYPNHFSELPDASEERRVQIIAPTVSISRIGNERDFFVELSNATDYDIDVSGWELLGATKTFTMPKHTVIGAGGKMIISGKTSGLTVNDRYGLRLSTSAGDTAFQYSSESPAASSAGRTGKKQPNIAAMAVPGPVPVPEDGGTETTDLGAAVAYALGEEEMPGGNSFLWQAVFTGFVGVSAWAVYRIRRRASAGEPGSDFEILEE